VRLLKLMAVLGLDGRGFRAGLKEAEVGAGKFARGLKSQIASAFSAAAFTAYIKNVTEAVTRIKDLSEQYRITTDEVQQTDAALKRQGLQFEDLAGAMNKLAHARREAVEKDGDAREAFENLGATVADLKNPFLRHYDLLLKIANGGNTANMTIREESDLMELLGLKSLKLLSSLREIGDMKGVDIISEDAVQRIDRAEKGLSRIWSNLKAIAAEKMSDALLFWGEGVGLTTDNAWERRAKEANKPLTKEEIESANAAKRERMERDRRSAEQGLYTENKDAKEQFRKDEMHTFGKAFDIKAPSLSGIAASGGYSGGIANLDPRLFIEQNQLTELKSINAQLKQLQTIVGGKLGSGTGLLGVLTR